MTLEKFGTLVSGERAISILGDNMSQTFYDLDRGERTIAILGDNISQTFYEICGRKVLSAQMLGMSLLGLGTVLRFERDAWSVVNCLRQATK